MAQKLLAYYEEANKIGGFIAQFRLAILTKIASPNAGKLPDTPEYIQLFENALVEIKNESVKMKK